MLFLFRMLTGFCRVSITGSGKERFLNLCRNKKIYIWNLMGQNEAYVFHVSYRAFFLLEEMGEKTNTKINIEGKFGLPFFLYRNRKRKAFFAGCFLCMSLIYVLSLFVWEIQVIGTEQYTKEEILDYLKEKKIGCGVFKEKIDCAMLEEQIREDFEDTAWISCDLSGTLLTIQVKESIPISETKNQNNQTPSHIVAAKDGIITSIITRAGTPLVKKGDKVRKGDILISGEVHLYNDYDELLETATVRAQGDVKAETIYDYEDTFSLDFYEKIYSGAESKNYAFCAGSKSIFLPIKEISCEYADTIVEQKNLKLGRFFYLPFSIQIRTRREYRLEKILLTEEEAMEKARKKIENYLLKLKQEGKEVKQDMLDIFVQDGSCYVRGEIYVEELIGKIRNIP